MSEHIEGERLYPEGDQAVSPVFMALWDELGTADASLDATSAGDPRPQPKRQRAVAEMRYIGACMSILRYVHDLEARLGIAPAVNGETKT